MNEFYRSLDRTSSAKTLDEARLHLFAQKGNKQKLFLRVKAILLQHTTRSIYKGALIWENALETKPDFPNPADFEWIKNNDQLWAMLPEADALTKLTTNLPVQ